MTTLEIQKLAGKIVTLTTTDGDKYTGMLTCVWDRGKVSKVRIGQVGFGAVYVFIADISTIELKE